MPELSIRIIRRELGTSVFPILCSAAGKLAVLATGFFIDDRGTFLTCSHVFEDPDLPNPRYFFLPSDRGAISDAIEIIEIETHRQYDLALGGVPNFKSTPLPMSSRESRGGDKTKLHGYPGKLLTKSMELAKITVTDIALIHGNVDYSIPKHGRNFRAIVGDKIAPNGVSGGPLVDDHNQVIGVYSHYRKDAAVGLDNRGKFVSVFVKMNAVPFVPRR